MVARRLEQPFESIAEKVYQLLNPDTLVSWDDQSETTREWYRKQVSEALQ